jgi:hypothetical protein
MQEVGYDRVYTESTGKCILFYGKRNENYEIDTGFFVHKKIISAVERIEVEVLFINDRIIEIITL